jgi:hypothetical protein
VAGVGEKWKLTYLKVILSIFSKSDREGIQPLFSEECQSDALRKAAERHVYAAHSPKD